MATVGSEVFARETPRLIASDKVEGAPVRRSNGDNLGTIERVMIDKRNGKVVSAVMSFGGFLGRGEDFVRCRGACCAATRIWTRISSM